MAPAKYRRTTGAIGVLFLLLAGGALVAFRNAVTPLIALQLGGLSLAGVLDVAFTSGKYLSKGFSTDE